MRTNIFFKLVGDKAIILALSFILLTPTSVFGQTAPLVCDPLPEDSDQLMECLDIINQTPTNNTQTTEPIVGPGNGTWGMSTAYNPTDGTFLFASSTAGGSAIIVQIFNATTLQAVSQPVTIDQTNLFVGSPRAVYNPVTNHYFVMWGDERNGSSAYANFVAPDGTAIGSNFQVAGRVHPDSAGVELDSVNSRYLVYYENGGPNLVTVNYDGTVNPSYSYDREPAKYEGQINAEYIPDVNEYWFTYIYTVAGSDTAQEDDRVMLGRVNASTMEYVGEPIQLSDTRIGRNAFASPAIEYSPDDKATLVVWMERGNPAGTVGEYGCTVYPDLTKNCTFPVLTTATYPASSFYGSPRSLTYNPYTGTFAIATEDNNGGTTMVELLVNGTIVESREAIPPSGTNGNFQPTLGVTPFGFFILTSPDYRTPTLVSYQSNFQYTPPPPVVPWPSTPENLSTTEFAKTISQIYLYSLGLAGLLAVSMSVFGGYLVMSARGNAQQASKGKDFIYSALAGLVLLMAAYLILNTINTDLLNFNIPSFQNLGNQPPATTP